MSALINKLVVVFGVNAKLTATYSKKEVVYTDGTTKMVFPTDKASAKANGVYDVSLTVTPQAPEAEESPLTYQLTETFRAEEVTAKPTATKPAASQTPNIGFEARTRC